MSDNDCNILQFKDFNTNVINGWKGLQNDIDFCDLTLVCDENQIKLHKIVASTCSLVLRNILKHNLHKHPLIYLRGVKYTNLVNLVDFIYQGEVKIPPDEMNDLFNLAEDLQVAGLSKNYEEEIVNINNKDTKKKYKCIISKIDKEGKVVDINEDIAKTDYAVPSIKTTAEDEIFDMNEESDDVKRYCIDPVIKTNIVNQKFQNSKRTIKKSLNDKFSYKEDDINELVHQFDYKQENYNDITLDEMVDLKQSLGYNEDLHKNKSVISNEFPVKNANIENTEVNVDNPLQSNLECGQCNAKFSEPSILMTHKSLHEELAKKQLRAIKNKRNKSEPYIKNEVNYEQQNITNFTINYGFQSVRGLSSSCDVVSPNIEKRKTRNEFPVYKTNTEQGGAKLSEPLKQSYKCEECNTKFTQSASLSRHIKAVHDKIRYTCDLCDYSTTQKPILNKHLRMKH